ncbi:GD24853 [Drosophila simulans]|uniref:GD24853 n=1 Tax=Drosophila simulans TaxID=7240 RepID=B4NUM2_DROSI|nr:GD24853 [Drosophila simulans]
MKTETDTTAAAAAAAEETETAVKRAPSWVLGSGSGTLESWTPRRLALLLLLPRLAPCAPFAEPLTRCPGDDDDNDDDDGDIRATGSVVRWFGCSMDRWFGGSVVRGGAAE